MRPRRAWVSRVWCHTHACHSLTRAAEAGGLFQPLFLEGRREGEKEGKVEVNRFKSGVVA